MRRKRTPPACLYPLLQTLHLQNLTPMRRIALGEILATHFPGGIQAHGSELDDIGAEFAVEGVHGLHQAIALVSTAVLNRFPFYSSFILITWNSVRKGR